MDNSTNDFLGSLDSLTLSVHRIGIKTWPNLLHYIQHLPYGRNSSRSDLSTVISERKGTCSSKHAFLKTLADLNSIPNVNHILALYKMNNSNTPGIGNILDNTVLEYIPEAHCYLNISGKRIDLTNPLSNIADIEHDILEEIRIEPYQVNKYKVEYHQKYLRNWISSNNMDIEFDTLWGIREHAIQNLSTTH